MSHVTKLEYDQPMVVVNFQARKITSSREIARDEIDIDLSALPDHVNAFLRQNYLPDGALSEFKKLEKRARQFLHGRSLNTEIGYLVSTTEAVACVRKLDEIKSDYDFVKKDFLGRYEQLLADSEDKLRRDLAGWSSADKIIDAVRRIAPTAQQIEERISFDMQAFQVEPVSNFNADEQALLQAGLVSLRGGLFGKLISEVAKDAYVQLQRIDERRHETGERKARQRTVTAIRDLQAKIRKLAFIDTRAASLANVVEDALDVLPTDGPLTGNDYTNFVRIVEALADQEGLVRHVEHDKPLLAVSTDDETDDLDGINALADGDAEIPAEQVNESEEVTDTASEEGDLSNNQVEATADEATETVAEEPVATEVPVTQPAASNKKPKATMPAFDLSF
ncbi:hypothetical protein J7355_13490 [Endozoicomonas sp. G2_2]|uniref:DUF3150 domain-containing protein n=1 Tax=Endozoicomonas sp. G2_2 TaxID=2821092 RepID=UPI001ADCC17F|nr:DUF3150 domain-containing protein [Endozoicomonas sp. G2_2]MBO9471109.1 hypothetical protein [Endozoicomonas sp. G2_2]